MKYNVIEYCNICSAVSFLSEKAFVVLKQECLTVEKHNILFVMVLGFYLAFGRMESLHQATSQDIVALSHDQKFLV